MRKIFILIAVAFFSFPLSACSYFMLYKYASEEKRDDVADQRMSELERARSERMRGNGAAYRDEEIRAYENARGIKSAPEQIDSRPISAEELRARMEKQAEERRKNAR